MSTSADPPRITQHDVCGVVVTYHPDERFTARLGRVVQQLGNLVIVDNGSAADEVRMLQEAASEFALSLVLNPQNLGIAAALNIGIQHASLRGYRWVLLLDQDSEVQSTLLEVLGLVHRAFPDNKRLALIGSGYVDPRIAENEVDAHSPTDLSWEYAESVITSGSLLSLAAYRAIGPFREEFFIDHVDKEFCCRAHARGYAVIKTRRPLMLHSIGSPTEHRFLWIRKITTNHSADRRYYFARNDTVMLRESRNYRNGLWAAKGFSRSFRTIKRIVLYENAKITKTIAVIEGWWDGVCGNMGVRKRSGRGL